MRTSLAALIALFFITSTVSAQTEPWANKLFGAERTHDFGTVPRGALLKYSFKMTNIYKVPLEITKINISCGCLKAMSPVQTLQPQESTTLDIVMDGKAFSGPKTIKIEVIVGPQYVSTATLTVTANARQDVVFNPGEIDFGNVAKGGKITKQIDVEYAGNLDWRVKEIVKNASAPFDLTVEELPVNFRGRGYRLFATLKPDVTPGPFRQEIILKTTDPTNPVLTILAFGNIQGGSSLAIKPGNLNFGQIKIGSQETKRFVVSGGQDFQITSIAGLGNGLTAAIPNQTAKTQRVELSLNPAKTGPFRQELTIRTDQNETATIQIEADVLP